MYFTISKLDRIRAKQPLHAACQAITEERVQRLCVWCYLGCRTDAEQVYRNLAGSRKIYWSVSIQWYSYGKHIREKSQEFTVQRNVGMFDKSHWIIYVRMHRLYLFPSFSLSSWWENNVFTQKKPLPISQKSFITLKNLFFWTTRSRVLALYSSFSGTWCAHGNSVQYVNLFNFFALLFFSGEYQVWSKRRPNWYSYCRAITGSVKSLHISRYMQ